MKIKKEAQDSGENLIQSIQAVFDRLSKSDKEVEEIMDVMGNSISKQVEKKLQ